MPYSRELVVARLLISLVRSVSVEILHSDRFGTRADDVVLCCAVFIGQAESKPMTAGKLAKFAGMPRPTVVRKLNALQRDGVVRVNSGGQVFLVADIFGPDISAATDGNVALINRSAIKLSKMDTRRIARSKSTL